MLPLNDLDNVRPPPLRMKPQCVSDRDFPQNVYDFRGHLALAPCWRRQKVAVEIKYRHAPKPRVQEHRKVVPGNGHSRFRPTQRSRPAAAAALLPGHISAAASAAASAPRLELR